MVKYLTTEEGKKIPFCISYSALSAWGEETKKTINDLDENLDIYDIEPLFYFAMLAGARIAKETFPKYDRKGDAYLMLIDELYFPFMLALPDFFQGLMKK